MHVGNRAHMFNCFFILLQQHIFNNIFNNNYILIRKYCISLGVHLRTAPDTLHRLVSLILKANNEYFVLP